MKRSPGILILVLVCLLSPVLINAQGQPRTDQSGSAVPVQFNDYFGWQYERGSRLLCVPAKTRAFLGEAVVVSYYLEINVLVGSFQTLSENDYDGYGKTTVTQPGVLEARTINYQGESVQAALIKRIAIYPDLTGSLRLPTITGLVSYRSYFRTLNREVTSTQESILVESLPSGRPESFNGGVGNFRVSHNYSHTSLPLGDALLCTVKISGAGNFSQLNTPSLATVEGVQISSPTIQDQLTSAIEGSRYFTYTLLPRKPGTYTLPGIKYSWFDPARGEYQSYQGEQHILEVRSAGALAPLSDLFRQDLPLKLQPLLQRSTYPAWDNPALSLWYWLGLGLMLASVCASAVYARRRRFQETDPEAWEKHQAGLILRRFLKAATKSAQDESTDFYPQAEKGMQDYLVHQYRISKSLSTLEVAGALNEMGLDREVTELIADFMGYCQRKRFMPIAPTATQISADHDKLLDLVLTLSRLRKTSAGKRSRVRKQPRERKARRGGKQA